MNLYEIHQRTGELLKQVFEHTETNVEDIVRDGPNGISFLGAICNDVVEEMQRRIDRLEDDVASAERDHEDAERDLDRAAEKIEDLKFEVSGLKDELSDSERENTRLKAEIVSLEDRLSDAMKEISELEQSQ